MSAIADAPTLFDSLPVFVDEPRGAFVDAEPVPGAARDHETPAGRAELGGGEPTLDDLVTGAWEALGAQKVVACPVCGGEMAPRYAASGRPVGGGCRSCGSTLS